MKLKHTVLALTLSLLSLNCGKVGSSSNGFLNPNIDPLPPVIRTVGGTLTNKLVKNHNACNDIDTVEFYDLDNNTIEAQVNEDCSFSAELLSQKSWGASFISNNIEIATLRVFRGAGLGSSYFFFLSSQDGPINLGDITINGTLAYAQKNPYLYNDRDNDGVADLNDADDDGDNIPDYLEPDCDQNGIIDDDELHTC